MSFIALIDYGMGNLMSVSKALESVGGKVRLVRTPADAQGADAVVLPGVGAFGEMPCARGDLHPAVGIRCRSGSGGSLSLGGFLRGSFRLGSLRGSGRLLFFWYKG